MPITRREYLRIKFPRTLKIVVVGEKGGRATLTIHFVCAMFHRILPFSSLERGGGIQVSNPVTQFAHNDVASWSVQARESFGFELKIPARAPFDPSVFPTPPVALSVKLSTTTKKMLRKDRSRAERYHRPGNSKSRRRRCQAKLISRYPSYGISISLFDRAWNRRSKRKQSTRKTDLLSRIR